MSLDTSSEGPAIQKSIKSIVNNSLSGAKSPTYATWLVLYVQTPLKNAFSSGPAKPSVLKVQGVGGKLMLFCLCFLFCLCGEERRKELLSHLAGVYYGIEGRGEVDKMW